jgi:DNA (cytosine-5)-methyltransferase 1
VCFKSEDLFNLFDFNFPFGDSGASIEGNNNSVSVPMGLKELLETERAIPDKYYYTDRFKVYPIIADPEKGVVKSIDENVIYQYRRYYLRENKNNVCPTLTANMGGGGHNVPLLRDDKGIRKLTPRECFNLQGFPSDYILPKMSDSALYKLAGNAVSVPVVKMIAEKIVGIISATLLKGR